MRADAVILALGLLAQQTGPAPVDEMAVLKAGLGSCSADFVVKDQSGSAVYGASIHVRVRYGLWSVKRSDLEVGTNSDGRARMEGLPEKARELRYEVTRGDRKAVVVQNVSATCHGTYDVVLK